MFSASNRVEMITFLCLQLMNQLQPIVFSDLFNLVSPELSMTSKNGHTIPLRMKPLVMVTWRMTNIEAFPFIEGTSTKSCHL